MFVGDASDRLSRPEKARESTAAARIGLPVDPRRVVAAFRAAARKLLLVALVSVAAGALVAKFLIPKTFVGSATVLWEPGATARADAAREIATLAQSVKLPANMLKVRAQLGASESVEALAKTIDVSLGESSMLINVSAKASKAEMAADVANTVVTVFLDSQRELSANRLREIVVGLRQSLVQSEAALAESRGRYDVFRGENHVADFPLEVQGAIAELARLHLAASDARVELQGLEAREGALKQSQDQSPEQLVVMRNEQMPDTARISELETELAEKRGKLSEDHPQVQALAAELAALKARGSVAPAVTSQTVGRNTVRDAVSAQLEESTAVRRSVEERTKALGQMTVEAEQRAQQLTGVQGEAARMLSDVKANEEHVAILFKQIATSEDDVRSAASNFQLVSRATPPEGSEHVLRRVVALLFPVLALLAAGLVVLTREFRRLHVRTAREAAYWGKAPVLCATAWPAGSEEEAARLARELCDATDRGPAVVGIASFAGAPSSGELVELLMQALRRRDVRCAAHDGTAMPARSKMSLADWIERPSFGKQIASLRDTHGLVLVALPSLAQRDAVRTAQRWLDALLLLVPSGKASALELARVRDDLGISGTGLGLVLVSDPSVAGSAPVGESGLMWRPSASPELVAQNAGTAKRGRRPRRRAEDATPSDIHTLEEFEEPDAPAEARSDPAREPTGH
jgi:uncharacterized protein involved in exopolysaccharide biosynthesis